MTTENIVHNYLDDLGRLLHEVDTAWVDRLVAALLKAWQNGNRVLLMGNGGSSSSVSHIVADLQKSVQQATGKALRAICLTDCNPLLMAWANDTAWHNVFAPQIACWAEPGDIVIGVSGSGNSMNVIQGIQAAKEQGARTFGMAGFGGGKLKHAAEDCLVVDSDSMQRVEDVHMILLHIAFVALLQCATVSMMPGDERALVGSTQDAVG
jgi:D-sedoheptulose 7-phosphate isomerase